MLSSVQRLMPSWCQNVCLIKQCHRFIPVHGVASRKLTKASCIFLRLNALCNSICKWNTTINRACRYPYIPSPLSQKESNVNRQKNVATCSTKFTAQVLAQLESIFCEDLTWVTRLETCYQCLNCFESQIKVTAWLGHKNAVVFEIACFRVGNCL